MSGAITLIEDAAVLELRINRPECKNALNLAMYQTLAGAINDAPSRGIRALVLCGEGECFTSGNDLSDFANAGELTAGDNPIKQFIYAMLDCPIPIVVAVHGVAVGIGTTLLLHSDLVYAAPDARFRLPFVNLGLCPEFASSLMLPSIAGRVKAAEWLLLGEFFSAQDALAGSVINRIVDDPHSEARSQAQKLARQAPGALREAKALMRDHPPRALLDAVLQKEFEAFSKRLAGPEFAEAAAAFFEKRPADFSSFNP